MSVSNVVHDTCNLIISRLLELSVPDFIPVGYLLRAILFSFRATFTCMVCVPFLQHKKSKHFVGKYPNFDKLCITVLDFTHYEWVFLRVLTISTACNIVRWFHLTFEYSGQTQRVHVQRFRSQPYIMDPTNPFNDMYHGLFGRAWDWEDVAMEATVWLRNPIFRNVGNTKARWW